jgi:hypothetical protein
LVSSLPSICIFGHFPDSLSPRSIGRSPRLIPARGRHPCRDQNLQKRGREPIGWLLGIDGCCIRSMAGSEITVPLAFCANKPSRSRKAPRSMAFNLLPLERPSLGRRSLEFKTASAPLPHHPAWDSLPRRLHESALTQTVMGRLNSLKLTLDRTTLRPAPWQHVFEDLETADRQVASRKPWPARRTRRRCSTKS